MASRFELTSVWILAADRELVYDTIADAERWRDWWPGLVEAERVAPGDERGIGERGRFTWKAPIGYRLSFEVTTIGRERPELLEAEVDGDLEGTGRWSFSGDHDRAEVRYEWDVAPAGFLRSGLSRILRPVLVREHDRLMAAGARGLAAHLGCKLLAGG